MKKKFSFPKSSRILQKNDFKKISQSTHRSIEKYTIIQWSKNRLEKSRLGIIASRKFGKANHRNRFKRIVREASRLTQHELPLSYDFVVRPRSAAREAKLKDILNELKNIRDKIGREELPPSA